MAETIGLNDRLRFSKAGAPSQTRSLLASSAVVGVFDRTNDGTAGTNVTAEEVGGRHHHQTILTLDGVAITIGDNASLGMGALIYTLPAGPIVIHAAHINAGLTLTTGTPTTDTPEMGLGTVIASGAVAVLGGTATFEDIIAGASTPVLADIAGTADLFTHVCDLKIETADAHTVHINFADAWANVDDTAATADGTVVLDWSYFGA